MLYKVSAIGSGIAEPEEGTRVKVVVKGTVVRVDPDGELVIHPDGADTYANSCMPIEASFKVLDGSGDGSLEIGAVYRDADRDIVIRLSNGGWYCPRLQREQGDEWATRPLTKLASANA